MAMKMDWKADTVFVCGDAATGRPCHCRLLVHRILLVIVRRFC